MKFPVPGFCLGHPQILWTFAEQTSRQRISFCLPFSLYIAQLSRVSPLKKNRFKCFSSLSGCKLTTTKILRSQVVWVCNEYVTCLYSSAISLFFSWFSLSFSLFPLFQKAERQFYQDSPSTVHFPKECVFEYIRLQLPQLGRANARNQYFSLSPTHGFQEPS